MTPDPDHKEVDTSRFHGQQKLPQDDPICEQMDDDPPKYDASLQPHLPMWQDGVAESQIAPTDVVSSQSPLPAKQDDATDSQTTSNPAYDAINQQEHILAHGQ